MEGIHYAGLIFFVGSLSALISLSSCSNHGRETKAWYPGIITVGKTPPIPVSLEVSPEEDGDHPEKAVTIVLPLAR